jgi:hypothetical protein
MKPLLFLLVAASVPVEVRIGDTIVLLPMSDGSGAAPAEKHIAVTVDPHSKILMHSDAIDRYQLWKANQPKPDQ